MAGTQTQQLLVFVSLCCRFLGFEWIMNSKLKTFILSFFFSSWCFSITVIIQQNTFFFLFIYIIISKEKKKRRDETANKIKNHALLTRQHMRVVPMSKQKINSRQLCGTFSSSSFARYRIQQSLNHTHINIHTKLTAW